MEAYAYRVSVMSGFSSLKNSPRGTCSADWRTSAIWQFWRGRQREWGPLCSEAQHRNGDAADAPCGEGRGAERPWQRPSGAAN